MSLHLDRLRSMPLASLAICGFCALLLGAKLWLIQEFGSSVPFWDQWDGEARLYLPFMDGTLTLEQLFSRHNEHRILVPRFLALSLLELNGIWNPLLQMIVNALLHVLSIVLILLLMAPILGQRYLLVTLSFSTFLFGLPFAWENTLAGFQSAFYLLIIFSVLALWLLSESDSLSPRWWLGFVSGILAFFSLASGSLTIATMVVMALYFYLTGVIRNRRQLVGLFFLTALFLACALAISETTHNSQLRAQSVAEFGAALLRFFSWPYPGHALPALLLLTPILAFVGMMLWRRPSAGARAWVLVAFCVWFLGQGMAISFGRANEPLGSRYLDLCSFGLLVEFCCLLVVAINCRQSSAHRWILALATVWVGATVMGLGLYTAEYLPRQLEAKRSQSAHQEANVRNYVRTGDFSHLNNKPPLHIPYPDADALRSLLDMATVRAILPAAIRPPLELMEFDSDPSDAFVRSGVYPTTAPYQGNTIGSYGAVGNNATGTARMSFRHDNGTERVKIPVAGYPINGGNRIGMMGADGIEILRPADNPRESWQFIETELGEGPLQLVVTDASDAWWLAVGSPIETGQLDSKVEYVLRNYYMFFILGITIVLILMMIYAEPWISSNKYKAIAS